MMKTLAITVFALGALLTVLTGCATPAGTDPSTEGLAPLPDQNVTPVDIQEKQSDVFRSLAY